MRSAGYPVAIRGEINPSQFKCFDPAMPAGVCGRRRADCSMGGRRGKKSSNPPSKVLQACSVSVSVDPGD